MRRGPKGIDSSGSSSVFSGEEATRGDVAGGDEVCETSGFATPKKTVSFFFFFFFFFFGGRDGSDLVWRGPSLGDAISE